MLDSENLPGALSMLGDILNSRGLSLEAVAIGGSVLVLLGYVRRSTRDVDLVARVEQGRLVSASPLPADVAEAIADVARTLGLRSDWMNAGPTSALELGLPAGFMERLTTRRFGGLTLHLAGRWDLIALKLYAAVDHGPASRHTADLQTLAPTPAELMASARS
jgi:hypothetical protein